jgi:hypothetical protein
VEKHPLHPQLVGGAWRIDTSVADQPVTVIRNVHYPGRCELLLVVNALDAFSGGLRSGKGWQQHSGKDTNNGDDHEQLHQRERAAAFTGSAHRFGGRTHHVT